MVFASDWVQGEMISRFLRSRHVGVRNFLAESGGVPSVASLWVALWEQCAHAALQRGGSFSCRDLQHPEAGAFEIQVEPCSSSGGLRDVQNISTGLSNGVYGWGRSKNLPAAEAVQPARLLQITMSRDHSTSARSMTDAARAMQGGGRKVKLFFCGPRDVFGRYTKQI